MFSATARHQISNEAKWRQGGGATDYFGPELPFRHKVLLQALLHSSNNSSPAKEEWKQKQQNICFWPLTFHRILNQGRQRITRRG